MDKNQAVRLLDETFNNDFDTNRFSKFTKELLNNFKIEPKSWTVWEAFKEYIDSFQLLGSYEDSSKKVIDVLVVKLKRTGSVDRARTMQRNFIAKWLGNAEKDAALVAFYGDDPQDWRFSFVKMEYQLVKQEDGKVKIAKELTPAKRYSFLVGVNEPNHTCKSQFVSLLVQEDVNPVMGEIEAAFSIDKVAKEFFINYKGLYLKLKDALEKHIKKDSFIRKEFEENAISTVDFAKKLLGQIVFIYFLQKKGWLGVQKDKSGKFMSWGSGPKNFLRKLFEKKNYKNFFNDVLEPLFYEALATERDDDYYSKFECKIPFLNGGLFEPINDYNWRETDLLLDNPIFENILNTFDRFNFTVKEDEPLEKEVAIDPEMLGKVFENLIEENIRKGQGSYYTPREIVHYMCQQSLINYLETNTGIARGDIEKFIQLGDFATEILIMDKKKTKMYGKSVIPDEEHKLPKSIRDNYAKIDKLLQKIKIVDPAVGSGAFPVGMMNEIVKARSILSIFLSDAEQKERTNYNLKREVIENCLYGVDIDSSAVDIAKLRFWLSLIVDEMDMKNIKPLPNLDHKIMCGNSLLEEFEGHKLFDDKLLGEVKRDYSFEIKQIDNKIAKLNQEKGEIARGKLKNGKSIKDIDKEINSLIKKKQRILSAPKSDERNATFEEVVDKKIKESQKKLRELKELQHKFFNEQNRKLKKEYRDTIEKIEWELIEETLKEQGNEEAMKKLQKFKKDKSKPFFLWKLYFAEVFQRENPGFDVVIANPPYLEARSPDFTDEMKEDLQLFVKNEYPTDYYLIQRGCDLLIYFYIRSIQLVRKEGIITFISQNSWLDTDYGRKFQQFILNHTRIKAIVDSDYKHFDTANINTVITFFVGNHCDTDGDEKIFFLRYHNSFEKILYSFSKISQSKYLKEDITCKIFTRDELQRGDYKWGLLLYSDKEFLDILKITGNIGKKIDEVNEIEISCGQGINLAKEYLIEDKIAKMISKNSAIPIMTSEEGAPYELKNTHYFLIDKSKITDKYKKELKMRGLKLFDKTRTNKIPPSLILPRGISRHYCSFNSINAYSSSGVDIYINKNDRLIYDKVALRLWLFLNSSLLWLIREISGRKNLGGGMLKAEATDLKQFELYFEFDLTLCQKVFNNLRNREASKTREEITKSTHLELDNIVFDYLKLTDEQRKYVLKKLDSLLTKREEKAISRR